MLRRGRLWITAGVSGINYREYCMEQWGEVFAGIPVLDYIIVNTDRHTQNYGFMMNNETGKIERLAPLFDFNCALVADYFAHDARDTLSQMFNTAGDAEGTGISVQGTHENRFQRRKVYESRREKREVQIYIRTGVCENTGMGLA